MPFKIPTSIKIQEKIQRLSLEKKGVKRGVGNVRTGNPNSASRISSGTFFGVL